MRDEHCDILIVGGGPAGTSAALKAAQMGCRVILAERKPAIGIPVRCAEYIPAPLVGQVNLIHKRGRDYVVQAIKGMKTHLPDGEIKETRTPGFTINRGRFDQALADAALKAGADIRLGAFVIGRDKDRVILLTEGQKQAIQAKVVIGADGPHSKIGEWMGVPNKNLMAGAQVTAGLVQPLEHTQVFLDPQIYGGYGWVFPKGGVANVGVGIKPRKGEGSVKKILDAFISKLVRENMIRDPKPQRHVAGWIPAEPVKKVSQGNILLAGDAAGHTHPITGAGIFSAVAGGEMAGKWAARAVLENDIHQLKEYEKEVLDFFGPHLKRAFDRRCLMEKEWGRFDEIIQRCWVAFREYYAK